MLTSARLSCVPLVALAGNRLGAVRDAKGKSVAQVFAGLGASQKAEVSPSCVIESYCVVSAERRGDRRS